MIHVLALLLYGHGHCHLHHTFREFLIEWENLSSESNLSQALGQTADWFRRALSVEPVKGNLRLSGYSACGQDGGVQLPREYVEGIFIAIE